MENNEKEMEIITTEEDIYESDPENNENKKYDEARVYYVYEHIRLDKMEPFYIGKGKGERAYDLYRNDHHDAITDEYGHAVVIIADNLTEEEAYLLFREAWMHTFSVCVLEANNICHFSDEEISEILSVEFRGALLLIKSGNYHPVSNAGIN